MEFGKDFGDGVGVMADFGRDDKRRTLFGKLNKVLERYMKDGKVGQCHSRIVTYLESSGS